MKDALTLSDILTRRLSLQWSDGIAIVRAVAERLLEHQGVESRIPELHQIELAADGSVTLTGEGSAVEPVRRLGQLLQALLNDAEVPVQLRLAVSQATAPIPSYPSMTEFDRALAYFERPDRAAILKNLYARATAAGPVATENDDAPTLDRIAPLPEVSGPTVPARSRAKSSRGMTAVGLALAAVVALTVAGTLYVQSAGMPFKVREVSRVTVAAADAVGAVVMTGVSAVSDRAGLGRLVLADEVAAPPSATVVASPLARRGRSMPVRRGAGAEPPSPVTAADNDAELPGTVVAYEVPPHIATALAPAVETSASVVAGETLQEVYTSDSEGVTPPVHVRQQLPKALPAAVDPANLSRIEIVIAPDGSVESARLLDNRPNVLGGMLLSAVKTWEFHPAMKSSVAVPYRKIILVSFE